MKTKTEYFWHVDKFNTEGKDKVPFKSLDDGSFKVLFPHKMFQHNLCQLFDFKYLCILSLVLKVTGSFSQSFEVT